MVEQLTLNQLVYGSSPYRGTTFNRLFQQAVFFVSIISGKCGIFMAAYAQSAVQIQE
jgi:hypothetical protein